MRVSTFFEYLRLLCVALGFFLGYYYADEGNYSLSLSLFMPFFVFSLSGLTGIESLFFGQAGAKSLGRVPGGPYQLQSGACCLSVAIVALIVLVFSWGNFAMVAMIFCTLVFIILSAIIHACEIFSAGNRSIKNAMRPVLTLAMVVAIIPLLIDYIGAL